MRVPYPIFVTLVVVALALFGPSTATAQGAQPVATPAPEPNSFNTWLREQVQAVNEAVKAEGAIAQNGNGVANQTESASADQASTSLVDTSSASDFASMALSVTGLGAAKGTDPNPKSGSVTATLYSLMAAVKGISITDPQFYKNGTKWRRLSLTIGTEESKLEEHFTDKASTNVGAKFLILNSRDVYSPNGQTQLAAMGPVVDDFARFEQKAVNELQCLIFRTLNTAASREGDCRKEDTAAFLAFLQTNPFSPENWSKTLEKMQSHPAAMREVSRTVEQLAVNREEAAKRISTAVEKIQRGRQLSIACYTKQREKNGTDELRAELIFDYGLSDRLNWTANASYDYHDHKKSKDTRSSRFATEFQAKLSNPGGHLWSARPVTLSASGEASNSSESQWLIRAQVKLVLPVTAGVDIPISYTYANRDDEGIVSGSQMKVSLALDPVRLRERFRLVPGGL